MYSILDDSKSRPKMKSLITYIMIGLTVLILEITFLMTYHNPPSGIWTHPKMDEPIKHVIIR